MGEESNVRRLRPAYITAGGTAVADLSDDAILLRAVTQLREMVNTGHALDEAVAHQREYISRCTPADQLERSYRLLTQARRAIAGPEPMPVSCSSGRVIGGIEMTQPDDLVPSWYVVSDVGEDHSQRYVLYRVSVDDMGEYEGSPEGSYDDPEKALRDLAVRAGLIGQGLRAVGAAGQDDE